MKVFHFISKEHGLENIRKRRVKIATIRELNDPFELFGIDLSNADVRKSFYQFKNDFADTYGMICFSQKWDNPVQWSHYADKHRGICLGFDVPDAALVPVSYAGKRLVTEAERLISNRELTEADMFKILSTKYSHWRYEKEMRRYVKLGERDLKNGLYFLGFSHHLKLVQVIVGAQSDISRSALADALGQLACQVTVTKARLAFRSFRVVRQRSGKLWA